MKRFKVMLTLFIPGTLPGMLVLVMLLSITACGLKGDLVLPADDPVTADTTQQPKDKEKDSNKKKAVN